MIRRVVHSSEAEAGLLEFPAALPLHLLDGALPTQDSPWLGVWSAGDRRLADALVPGASDAALAAVLLRNLLDNALRYSPDGAQVQIRITPANAQEPMQLCVEDSGPGMTEAEMARLGERFFTTARPGGERSGSGLGLAIARSITERHRGSLRLQARAEGPGLLAILWWPRA